MQEKCSATIMRSTYRKMLLLAGPELAEMFMVNLERSLVTKLNVYLNFWRRYVNDTIAFIKIGSVEYLLCLKQLSSDDKI